MPRRSSYRDYLKQDLSGLIEALELSDLQKHFLRSRWLDQVLWMEGRANKSRTWYYWLRLITIIGGALITALAGINVNGASFDSGIKWVIFVLSLLVTISAAVEEFFHFGERWQHYRRTVEGLKIEGWQFFQLSGPYRRYASHTEAYPAIAARVENIIQRDVEVYISEVVREPEEEKKRQQPQ